jgi:hypothetical protein
MTNIEKIKKRVSDLEKQRGTRVDTREIPTIVILPDNGRRMDCPINSPGENPDDWEYVPEDPSGEQIAEAIKQGGGVVVTGRWQKKKTKTRH